MLVKRLRTQPWGLTPKNGYRFSGVIMPKRMDEKDQSSKRSPLRLASECVREEHAAALQTVLIDAVADAMRHMGFRLNAERSEPLR